MILSHVRFGFYLSSWLHPSIAASSSHSLPFSFLGVLLLTMSLPYTAMLPLPLFWLYLPILTSRTSFNLSMLLSPHVLLAPHTYLRTPPPLPPRYLKLFTCFNYSPDRFTVCRSTLSACSNRHSIRVFLVYCLSFPSLPALFSMILDILYTVYQINDLHTGPHRIQTSLILVRRFSLSVLVRPLWIRTGEHLYY